MTCASDAGVTIRAIGGAAIAIRCPAAKAAPFARPYKDIDVVTRGEAKNELERLFTETGYNAEPEFNAINAHRRLIFWDPSVGRKVDVFVDRIEMCHTLDIRDRLELDRDTLALADLLLLKLQIVEATEKDHLDALTLLADHGIGPEGIDGDYVADLLAKDWGWWRTVTRNLDRLLAFLRTFSALEGRGRETVEARIRQLVAQIENTPKSRRWRMRARVGERMQWYELPEETE